MHAHQDFVLAGLAHRCVHQAQRRRPIAALLQLVLTLGSLSLGVHCEHRKGNPDCVTQDRIHANLRQLRAGGNSSGAVYRLRA